ncbi:Alpha/Beta hydrolase protein [Lophiotrema nucula]|uniref:Alpha/Beta hydrolase protein n=1 Tax=Lophiotrema nucula TaxID=690887 RepID=A0A6A5ZC24_9PLEO|nr:Alpha/Beta hydrolase protein [Lophiotrema nucula]
MPNTKTIRVPHLGGIDAAYQMPHPYDASKPTLVLVNSFTTSSELYKEQYADKTLTSAMNLLAIELLGHGQTRIVAAENWTYWDTAIMNIQVLDALGIEKAFVLGTSQGGWVTVRMALLAPKRIQGIVPLGTSLDYESPRTRDHGCWDALSLLQPTISAFTSKDPTPDFEVVEEFRNSIIELGFGKECDSRLRAFWNQEIKRNYQGDEGRRRMRMASINLRDRDGLLNRLSDVVCPVLWLHGTADAVYSVANAEEEIKMFENSPDARLVVIKDGHHFLSASHPKEVAENILRFVESTTVANVFIRYYFAKRRLVRVHDHAHCNKLSSRQSQRWKTPEARPSAKRWCDKRHDLEGAQEQTVDDLKEVSRANCLRRSRSVGKLDTYSQVTFDGHDRISSAAPIDQGSCGEVKRKRYNAKVDLYDSFEVRPSLAWALAARCRTRDEALVSLHWYQRPGGWSRHPVGVQRTQAWRMRVRGL